MNSFPTFDFDRFPKNGDYEDFYRAVQELQEHFENIEHYGKLEIEAEDLKDVIQEAQDARASAPALPIEEEIQDTGRDLIIIEKKRSRVYKWRCSNSERFQKDAVWETICTKAKEKFEQTEYGKFSEWQTRRERWTQHAIFAHYTSTGLDGVYTSIKNIHILYKKALQALEESKLSQEFTTEYQKYLDEIKLWRNSRKQALVYSMLARLELAAKEEDVAYDDLLFPLYTQVHQLLDVHEEKEFYSDAPVRTMTPELFQKFHLSIFKYKKKAEREDIAKRVNALPWFYETSVPFGIKTIIHSKQLFVLPSDTSVKKFSTRYSGPSVCDLALYTIYWSKLKKLLPIGALNDLQQIQDIYKIIEQLVNFYIKQLDTAQRILRTNAKELQDVWEDRLQRESDTLFATITSLTDCFFKVVEADSKDILAFCPIFYKLNELADSAFSTGKAIAEYKKKRAYAQNVVSAQFGRAVLKQKMKPSAFFELFSVLTPPQLEEPIDILRRIIRDNQPSIQENILLTLEQVKGALKAIWPQNVNSILKSLIEFLVQKITDPRSPLLSIIKEYDASIQSSNRNEPTYIEQWLSAQNKRMKGAQETILKNFPLMEESYYFYGEDDIQSAIEQLKAYSEFEENLLNHLKSHLREYIQKKADSNYSNVLFGALIILQDQTLFYAYGKKLFEYYKQPSKALLADQKFFRLLSLCLPLQQELCKVIFEYMNSHIEEVIQDIANFADFSFLSGDQKKSIQHSIDKYYFRQLQKYYTIDEDILSEKLYRSESFSLTHILPEFPLTGRYKKALFKWLNNKLTQHADSADSALEKVLVRFGTVEQKQTFYTQCFEHVFGKSKSDEIAAQILLKSQLLGYRDFLEKYGDENLPKIFQVVKNFFRNPVFNPVLYTILESNFIIAEENQEQDSDSTIDDQNYSMYSYLCQQIEKVFNEQYSVIVNTIDCLEKGSYKEAHGLAEKLEEQVPASGRRIFTETDYHAKEVMKLLFKRIEEWLLEQITDTKKYSIDSIKSFVNLFKKEFLTLFIDKQKTELNELLKPLFTLCEKTSDIFNFCSGIYNLVHSAPYTSWLVPFRRKDLSEMFELLPIAAKKFLFNQLIKISLIGQSEEAREAWVLLIAVIKGQSTDRERDLNRIQGLAASESSKAIQENSNDVEGDHALLSERNWDSQLRAHFPQCQGDEKHIVQLLRMGSRHILQETWNQLFDETGSPLFGKKRVSCRHTVIPVTSTDKKVFYYKFLPDAPGIQWMSCALRELLWGEKQQKTFKIELAKFPAGTGDISIDYPVLISQEVPGKTLSELWQENPNIRLNAHSFSREFLRVLIDLEQDGKPENYIAVAMDDRSYQLVNVDGEQAFAPSGVSNNISDTGMVTTQLLTKSILFCCPNMKEKISNEVIDEFLEIEPIEFLQTFIREIYRYNTLLLQLFSNKECMLWWKKEEQRFLVAPLREDLIQSMYTTIYRIQEAFHQAKSKGGITHIELLRKVHPLISSHYDSVLDEEIHPSKRFLKVVANEYKVVHNLVKNQDLFLTSRTNTQVIASMFGFIPNAREAISSHVIDADKALHYLESIASQSIVIQQAQQELISGINKTWKEIKLPLFKEQVINGISGVLPGIMQQELSKDKQIFILKSIIYEIQRNRLSLQTLNLSYCSALSNGWLKKIVEVSRELKFLDISYCSQIDEAIFYELSAYCPMLLELRVDGLLITTLGNKENIGSPLEFFQLRVLSCDNCRQLTHVALRCPQLQDIDLCNSEQLTKLSLDGQLNLLKKINLAKCKRITDQELLGLIRKCPNLEELELWDTEVSCEGFEELFHQLRLLKRINLNLCKKLTDRGLIALLKNCPNIEQLELWFTEEVSCEGFGELSYQLGLLKKIHLNRCRKLTDRGLVALLEKCPHIEELELWDTEISDKGVENIVHKLSTLKRISLFLCKNLTDRGLVALLEKCPHIEELELRGTEVSCEGFGKLSYQLVALKKINLSDCEILTDQGLGVLLEKCLHIEELDLSNTEISCEGFGIIDHQLNSLKIVKLSNCKKLTDKGLIAFIQKCPQLAMREIDLSASNKVTDQGLIAFLEKYPHIEKLDLSDTEISCEGFENIELQLNSLRIVKLSKCNKLTDQGLVALLKKCSHIEELDLSDTEISCEGFENIEFQLNSLRIVKLSSCKKLTDQGLIAIVQKCPQLSMREIDLSTSNKVTDKGLVALLGKCPNIKKLDLSNTEMSCEEFVNFPHQLESLKIIELHNCKKLTDQGFVALLEKCSHIEILSLLHTEVSFKGIEKLSLSSLKLVILTDCKKVTDRRLFAFLKKCLHIENIHLSYTKISFERFKEYSYQLSTLKKISLFHCKEITDKGLVAFLEKCPNIEELDLSNTEMSCEGFVNLSPQLNSLKNIKLRNCKKLTDKGLIALTQKCPQLSMWEIDLSTSNKVTDKGLVALLEKRPNIEELDLSNTEMSCEEFVDLSLQLNSLKNIKLRNCKKLTDKGLIALTKKCPQLSMWEIDLSASKEVTDQGLVALLEKRPNIEELDLSNTEMSCEWFENLSHQLNSLKSVNLHNCKKVTDQGLIALLKKCPNIEELDLWGTGVSCEGFKELSYQLNSLKKIHLFNCTKVTNRGLIALVQKCPQLSMSKIDLSAIKDVTNHELFALLEMCSNIEELNLSGTKISFERFENIELQLNSLKIIKLSNCKKLTDQGLVALLKKCPHIEELNLLSTEVSCEGFEKLVHQLIALKKINLTSCTKVTNRGLIALTQKCPQLSAWEIDLSASKEVTDQGLVALLGKCPNIKKLDLSNTEMSCEEFENIDVQLNSLRIVKLSKCKKLTDRGLIAFLEKCPNIEELDLWCTEVRYESFEKLSYQLSSLKKIDLSLCKKLTDQGLVALLEKCPNIEELSLRYTEVSCEGFKELSYQLSSLRKIDLSSCTKVTNRGLIALTKKCPQLSMWEIDLSASKEITDQGLVALLGKRPNIEELDLSNTEMSCEWFVTLSHQLNSLKIVKLSNCKKLTDQGLVALLGKCPNIEKLDLWDTEVSCERFAELSHQLNSLKIVNLSNCKKLTDQGLIALLEKCLNIKKLDLWNTKVSCERFGKLVSQLSALKKVDLSRCNKLTNRGFIALTQKCPHLMEVDLQETSITRDIVITLRDKGLIIHASE